MYLKSFFFPFVVFDQATTILEKKIYNTHGTIILFKYPINTINHSLNYQTTKNDTTKHFFDPSHLIKYTQSIANN